MNANEIGLREVTAEELQRVDGGWGAWALLWREILIEFGDTPQQATQKAASMSPHEGA